MGNEVIVSAAHYEPKLDIIIPCVRHADDIFYEHFILQREKHPDLGSIFWEQGFITNKMRYVNRDEAMQIAIKNNQIRKLVGSQTLENLHTHELFSENLY